MVTNADKAAIKSAITPTSAPYAGILGLIGYNAPPPQASPPSQWVSRDVQNVLYSMDIATLLLDRALTIRFFTPTIQRLFHIIPSDIGRPLSDLRPYAPDDALVQDVASVISSGCPVAREIASSTGEWFARKMLPFRTDGIDVDGVVITYTDITEYKHAVTTLKSDMIQADAENTAKSRFIAGASHDLRQPLQALKLVQGMLSRIVVSAEAQLLVERLDDTLGAMATMLNALRDINQIEARPVRAERVTLPVDAGSLVFLVDDDDTVRDLIRIVLEDGGMTVEAFPSAEDFLSAFRPCKEGCLLVDGYLPGMSGLDLLRKLQSEGINLPSVMITGFSDVAMAVEAMKAGACDFIEKPLDRDALLGCVARALHRSRKASEVAERCESASAQLASLTPRQRQILQRVLAGEASKIIASDLHISQRTVENHRAIIMRKTGSRSLPALARLAQDSQGGKSVT